MFILQNIQDGSYFGAKSFYIKSEFKSVGSAKAAMTRYAKKHADVFVAEEHVITNLEDYVEPQVSRTKVLPGTGEKRTYSIGINSVGTCTDPGTETYWSM
tara:strand:- start:4276 stop:4575 length:300 start_codon:yes stop_codon:yes gene_type:complete